MESGKTVMGGRMLQRQVPASALAAVFFPIGTLRWRLFQIWAMEGKTEWTRYPLFLAVALLCGAGYLVLLAFLLRKRQWWMAAAMMAPLLILAALLFWG